MSVDGLSKLLHIYTYASSIKEENRDNISEFLMIVNAGIRKAAQDNEDQLRVHFKKEEPVNNIIDDSDIDIESIRDNIEECIHFLYEVSTKLKTARKGKNKKELLDLIAVFNTAILSGVRDAKDLVLKKRANAREAAAEKAVMNSLIAALGGLDMKRGDAEAAAGAAAEAAAGAAAGAANEEMEENDPSIGELAAALGQLGV
jgi:predicted DNA-binding protein YlxM (UPF0122 family)